MVWASPFEQLLEVVLGILGELPTPLQSAVATSEPSHRYLFFFLLGRLAVENCPDHLLA